MTTFRIIAIFLALWTVFESHACECFSYDLAKLDNESLQASDLVVVGDVVQTGTNYKVKIFEVLKGSIEGDIINGTIGDDNCTFFPDKKGRYLLYLNKIVKDGKSFYEYSQCYGTRLLSMEFYPFSLQSDKTKEELVYETARWIESLRTKE